MRIVFITWTRRMRQAYRDATKVAISCAGGGLLQNLQKKQVEGACPLRAEGRLVWRPSTLIERNSSPCQNATIHIASRHNANMIQALII